jgi:hypothetical protein
VELPGKWQETIGRSKDETGIGSASRSSNNWPSSGLIAPIGLIPL